MMKNSDDFSKEAIMRLATSPAGQQLMALLRSQHPDAVESVKQNADNPEQAKNALAGFLADPKVQELMRKLQEDYDG